MPKGKRFTRFGGGVSLAHLGVLAAVIFLAGCAAGSLFQGYRPLEQQTGVLRWQTRQGDALNADAYFSRGSENSVALLIGKQGPQPLLEAVLSNGTFSIRGPILRGLNWAGPVNAAPAKVAPWAALLSAYSQAPALAGGSQEFHTGAYRAQFLKSDQKLKALFVFCNDTGDTFNVRF